MNLTIKECIPGVRACRKMGRSWAEVETLLRDKCGISDQKILAYLKRCLEEETTPNWDYEIDNTDLTVR